MTPDSWLHVGIYIVGLIAASVGHAFYMGRKFEGVNGRMDRIQDSIDGRFKTQAVEDGHCKEDRERLTQHVGKIFGTMELHGQEIAVLRGEAKTWRKGEAHG